MEFRLSHLTSSSYDDFEATFSKELNRHAPLKKEILQHNNKLFMTNEKKRKAIILRSKLKSNFNKGKIHFHCIKSVRIPSYSGPHFPLFGLNTERYGNLSVFSPNVGKYEPE